MSKEKQVRNKKINSYSYLNDRYSSHLRKGVSMAIKNLVRYYSQENVNLVMLKRHKYICINNYDESFNDFLEKPQIKQVLGSIALQEG